MNRLSSLLLSVLLLLFAPILRAGELLLTDNGRALCEIVLPPEASPPEKFAARELQDSIGLAAGAVVPIAEPGGTERQVVRIVLGTPENQPEIAALGLKSSPEEDEIVIRRKGDILYLGGSNPRSVYYAATRFLEKTLGFRWLWPGESGTFFKRTASLTVDALDLREKPALWRRMLSINSPHYDEDTVLWMARQRMNAYNFPLGHRDTPKNRARMMEWVANLREKGFILRSGGHNLVLPHVMLKEHPDWVAEVRGERTLPANGRSHLCWSNPSARGAVAQMLLRWMEAYPFIDIISILPVDNNHFCECTACGEYAPDVSTRYQKFCADVIRQVRDVRPEARFETLGYQAYKAVPGMIAPFDMLGYAAYGISYRYFISGEEPQDAHSIAEIKGWIASGMKTGLRGYDMIPFTESMFTPMVSWQVDMVRWCVANGLVSYSTEVTPWDWPKPKPDGRKPTPRDLVERHRTNWFTNRMNLYALATALWDKDVSAHEIVDDWTRTVYGEAAAKPMARYYNAMEKAWRTGSPRRLAYFGTDPAGFANDWISKALIEEVNRDFAEARALLAREQDEGTRKRAMAQVAAERKMFGEWDELYRLASPGGDALGVVAVRTRADDSQIIDPSDACWKEAGRFSPFLSVDGKAREDIDVSALWKEGMLYLRIARRGVAQDLKDDKVEILFRKMDFSGDCRIGIDSGGTLSAAFSEDGKNFVESGAFNGKATVRGEEDGWVAVVALPLAEVGYGPENFYHPDNLHSVQLSLRNAGSGWPDAGDYPGMMRLTRRMPAHVMMFRGNAKESDQQALVAHLRERGWRVTFEPESGELLPAPAGREVLFLNLNGVLERSFARYMTDVIYPWLSEGGLVVVCGKGLGERKLPFLVEESLSLKWSGWRTIPSTKCDWFDPGEWAKTPNDLTRLLENYRGGASSSYFPAEDSRWEILATTPAPPGERSAFLLRARVGKGTLVFTSAGMGFGGSGYKFERPPQAIDLLENFLHSANANEPQAAGSNRLSRTARH